MLAVCTHKSHKRKCCYKCDICILPYFYHAHPSGHASIPYKGYFRQHVINNSILNLNSFAKKWMDMQPTSNIHIHTYLYIARTLLALPCN